MIDSPYAYKFNPAPDYSTPFLAWLSPREQIRHIQREIKLLEAHRQENARELLKRDRLLKTARHRLDQTVLRRP